MIDGIHFLVTYQCTFACDHCFLYCSPKAKGVFTIEKIKAILDDSLNIPTVDNVFFEGGEPFLYYDIMLEGIKYATQLGLSVGIVTNGYWARTKAKALKYLKPLQELGVSSIGLSDDAFHYGDRQDTPPKIAHAVCEELGISNSYYCIEPPSIEMDHSQIPKGKPIVGGGTVFKGRAVDKLSGGLPFGNWKEFTTCPHEDIDKPERIHIDPFGNVFICQGISLGNVNQQPLSEMFKTYQPETHPILGPIQKGGPALLAETYQFDPSNDYIEPCHLCYAVRKSLLTRFKDQLTPAQVYGVF